MEYEVENGIPERNVKKTESDYCKAHYGTCGKCNSQSFVQAFLSCTGCSVVGSCGYAAPRMEIRIDSSDPQNIPGEIQVRGENTMLGYFKNEQATKEAFTEDGWMRTGDLGVMDSEGYLFIRGRSKNMLLGPSGQNIYPEEIESVINNMLYVVESLVIEDDGKLVALIYPDFEAAARDGFKTPEQLLAKMNENIAIVNEEMPN